LEPHGGVVDLPFNFTWLTGRNLGTNLVVLFDAVAFVLLIACVNIVNLCSAARLIAARNSAWSIRKARL
jgi:hypothetical protein